MLGTLLIKELQEIIVSKSYLSAFGISLLVFPISFYATGKSLVHAKGVYESTQKHKQSATVSARLTQRVASRPSPLRIFASGFSSSLARPVVIGRRQNVWLANKVNADPKREQEDLVFTYANPLDFLFISRIFLSLLAILFACVVVAEEKENRTLPIVLSNPVNRSKFLLAKWLSQMLTLSLIFAICYLGGILYVMISQEVSFDSQGHLRLLLIFGLSLLYIGIFSQLGVLISTQTTSTRVAMVGAMSIWFVLVLFIPSLATEAAAIVKAPPNSQQLQLAKLATERQLRQDANSQSAQSVPDQMLRHKIREKFDALEETYITAIFSNARLTKGLGIISPAMTFTDSILSLANSNLEDEYAYYRQLRSYVTLISQHDKTNTELLQDTPGANLAQFNFVERDLSSSLKSIFLNLVFLLTSFCGLTLLSFYSFRRYDAR